MNDVIIRVFDLPYCVKGQVLLDDEGDYNVYLNSRYGPDEIRKAFNHEMAHVVNEDFDGECSISEIEVC